MPLVWKRPETFLTYQGITVYHTYKDDNWNDRMEYWYSTDPTESDDDDYEFDIRNLKEYNPEKSHRDIIKEAIKNKNKSIKKFQND